MSCNTVTWRSSPGFVGRWVRRWMRCLFCCGYFQFAYNYVYYIYWLLWLYFPLQFFDPLQCFDAVGWAAGRASGPADATAIHCHFSKIQIDFTFLVPAYHPDSPRKRAVKRVCVCVCIIAVYMTCSEMLVRHWSAFVAWTVVGDSFI